MDGTSDSSCDGDDGVSLPSIVLKGINYWVIFRVFWVVACSGNLS